LTHTRKDRQDTQTDTDTDTDRQMMRLIVVLPVLLCLLIFTPTLILSETLSKCDGCTSLVDNFYHLLHQRYVKQRASKHGEPVHINAGDLVLNVCEEMHKSIFYGQPILKACTDFQNTNRDLITSTFAAQFEVSDNVDTFFQLKKKLCNAVEPGCVNEYLEPKMDKCTACRRLMNDMDRVVYWGLGRNDFLSDKLLFRNVDQDFCLSISIRQPLKHFSLLSETCTELIDDYQTSMVDFFQQKYSNGASSSSSSSSSSRSKSKTKTRNKVKISSSDSASDYICRDVAHFCDKDEL